MPKSAGIKKKSKQPKVPRHLWVQYEDGSPVKVPTEGCIDVGDLIESIKKKYTPTLDSFGISQLQLFAATSEEPLRRGLLLSAIPSQPGYTENSYSHPLYIITTTPGN